MSFFSKINGTTMQPNKAEIEMLLSSGNIEGVGLELRREPLNPYDSNAIAIYLDEVKMGYIPKATAENLAKDMDSGKHCYAIVSVVTGKEHQNRGCNIEVFIE